jgi:hypothetical protein
LLDNYDAKGRHRRRYCGQMVIFFFADFLLTQYGNSGAVCLLIMMQEGVGVWTGESCLFRGFSMDTGQ